MSATVLEGVTTVLLVDWPEKAVPEAWVRAGYETHSHEGPEPDEYYVYEIDGDEVAMTKTGRAPDRIDLVYTYRPADELPEIVDFAKGHGARWIFSGRFEAKDPHVGVVTTLRAELVVDGADQQPVEPRIEPTDVAQGRKVAPAADKGLLGRVLRPVGIAQDQPSKCVQAIDDAGGENVEGLAFTLPRPFDELWAAHEVPCRSGLLWCIPYWRSPTLKSSAAQ